MGKNWEIHWDWYWEKNLVKLWVHWLVQQREMSWDWHLVIHLEQHWEYLWVHWLVHEMVTD